MRTADMVRKWLGRQDSNLRVSAPKADALPLGDSPSHFGDRNIGGFSSNAETCDMTYLITDMSRARRIPGKCENSWTAAGHQSS